MGDELGGVSLGDGRTIAELGDIRRLRTRRMDNLRWINHAISAESVGRILWEEANIVEFDWRSESTEDISEVLLLRGVSSCPLATAIMRCAGADPLLCSTFRIASTLN